jgi:hypothetical protein
MHAMIWRIRKAMQKNYSLHFIKIVRIAIRMQQKTARMLLLRSVTVAISNKT